MEGKLKEQFIVNITIEIIYNKSYNEYIYLSYGCYFFNSKVTPGYFVLSLMCFIQNYTIKYK